MLYCLPRLVLITDVAFRLLITSLMSYCLPRLVLVTNVAFLPLITSLSFATCSFTNLLSQCTFNTDPVLMAHLCVHLYSPRAYQPFQCRHTCILKCSYTQIEKCLDVYMHRCNDTDKYSFTRRPTNTHQCIPFAHTTHAQLNKYPPNSPNKTHG